MRPRLRGAAMIANLLLSVAGCGGAHPTPPPLDATSKAASTTPTAADGASPTPSATTRPSSSATPPSASDTAAGQQAIQVLLAAVNKADEANSDAALKGTWQQSCSWCATVIQPIQMAAFAKSWQLTPAKIADPRISYWKNGISGQLLYRVTMSVSAMKLVDGTGHSQRSGAAIHAGSFSFAAQRVEGSWQVVQGIHGDIDAPVS